ncbi:universal stress protein [Oceanisphaera sp.]|uniref:universal stress protein n=1 Tax=Oceanisphaera sp. TaxID=1929979 RepID=UPI003A9526BD
MTTNVIACIDGSSQASAVCDSASWASQRLSAPLTFLHVQDKSRAAMDSNLSGSIGLGSQEQLLAQLADLDAQRSKLAIEQGRLMLEAAQDRALNNGVTATPLQRHGEFIETLVELEASTRLLILGRHGGDATSAYAHIGSQVEQAIRVLHCPVLVTQGEFKAPQKIMLAFDGSATTRKSVTMLADSPLLAGLEVHLVLVGADTAEHQEQLKWARALLDNAGIPSRSCIVPGDVEQALTTYQQQQGIDMIVMGAYGHSRIRQLLVGSTTTNMIRAAQVPLLILR